MVKIVIFELSRLIFFKLDSKITKSDSYFIHLFLNNFLKQLSFLNLQICIMLFVLIISFS